MSANVACSSIVMDKNAILIKRSDVSVEVDTDWASDP